MTETLVPTTSSRRWLALALLCAVQFMVTLTGALVALFVIRQDECEEAAARVSDPKKANARLAECRGAARL